MGLIKMNRTGRAGNVTAMLAIAVCLCGVLAAPAFAAGPEVFYPFNGTVTPLNDYSGFGRNAVLTAATRTADRNAVANNAYAFSGSGQYITSPYIQPSTSNYSISAWFNTSSSTGGNFVKPIVSSRGTGAGKSLSLLINPYANSGGVGRVYFGLDTNSVMCGIVTNDRFDNGAWHHVVGVFSGGGTVNTGQFAIYIDGALYTNLSGINIGSLPSAPFAGMTDTLIGYHRSFTRYFYGSIDEVGIYNRSLTAGDVSCLYYTTTAKNTWNFDTDGNVEGWSADSQISAGPTASGGQMHYSVPVGAGDPMLDSPQMEYPISQGSWLKVRAQNGSAATGSIMFWNSNVVTGFTGNYQANYPVNPNDSQISEYWVNMATAGGTYWTTATYIKQFRFDFPDGGGTLNGNFNVDQIAISSAGPPTPAVSTITQYNPVIATPTAAAQVTWDVRFNHTMTTVATNDFACTNAGGTAAGTVASVTQVGPTWYRVTANNLTGTGTLRLDAKTGGSGRDVASQAMTAGFTGGATYLIDRDGPAAPVLTGISPDSGDSPSDRITNATTNLTFSGTAEANSTVTLLAPPAPGDTVMRELTTTASGTGSWSILVPAVAEGVWNVQLKATDTLGNVGAWSSNYPTVIDTTVSGSSFVINGAAARTNTTAVTLTISTTNEAPLAWMQFSNDNSGSWSTYEAFNTTKAWTLASANGTRTVKARFKDVAGNESGIYQSTIILDTVRPNPLISTTAVNPTNVSPIPFTINFGESVTGFDATDITVTNGTATTVAGGPQTYTFGVIPSSSNTLVSVLVASGKANDLAGNANNVSNQKDIQYVNEQPTCTVTAVPTSPTKVSPIRFNIVFSNTVTGLTAGAIVVTDAHGANLTGVLGGAAGGTSYTLDVTPSADGPVTCQVPAGVVTRTDSNNELNLASNLASIISDRTGSTCVVAGPVSPTNISPIVFTLTFNEPVTGLSVSGITVTGGSKGTLGGVSGDSVYTLPVTPTGQGAVSCKVNAGAVLDIATNPSVVESNTLSITYDSIRPTATITAPTSPTKTSPMVFTIAFSESVTGLASPDDFVVTNGTAGALTGIGTSYSLNVIPAGEGAVTLTVKQDAAFDAAGNGNSTSNVPSATYDTVRPTLSITPPTSPTKTSPMVFTLTFSESVTGLASPAAFVVTNGTASTLSGSGASYTLNVLPTAQGPVSFTVNQDAALDAAGNGNSPAASPSVTYDTVGPNCIVSTTKTPTNSAPVFTMTFTEAVTGLSAAGLTVTNGSAETPLVQGGGTVGTVWTVVVDPAGQGNVTCQVNAGAAKDAAGNDSIVSNVFTILYDSIQPTCAITGPSAPITTLPIQVTLTFSEAVTGLTQASATLGGCVATSFAGSGTTYTMNLVPTGSGTVTCTLADSKATDAAGNGNSVSNTYTVAYTATNPTCWINADRNGAINQSPLVLTINFNEPVSGLTADGITVSTGTKGALTGGPNVYSLPVSGIASQATLTATVIAGAANSVSASKPNLASDPYSIVYDPVAPTITVLPISLSPTNATLITFTLSFGENVTGLAVAGPADLTGVKVVNGTNVVLSGGPRSYTVDVTPVATGDVTCQVLAGSALDRAINPNPASNTAAITYDGTPPSCVVSHVGAGGLVATKDNPIPFTLTFSEDVTGLTADGITVTGGTKGTLVGGPSVYTLPVTPLGDGPVTCQVAALAAVDHVGNLSTVSNQLSINYDSVAPVCTVTGVASTNANPVVFTLTFPEDVSTPDVAGIIVTGGTKGVVSGGPRVFTLPVTTVQGTQVSVTCQAGVGACTDLAGNANPLSNVATIAHDSVRPTCVVAGPASPTKNNPIVFTLTFSKPVSGLTTSGLTVGAGIANAVADSGAGTVWTAEVIPSGNGDGIGTDDAVTCQVKDGAAHDALGNTNTISGVASVTFDSTSPTCVVAAPAGASTDTSPITFTAVFSEPVTGLTASSFTLGNGLAGTLTGTGTSYSLTVIPLAVGAVTCTVPQGAASDAALNGNVLSNTASINYTNTHPACWITAPPSPTVNNPIVFTINFGQPVTGLTVEEIVVPVGTKESFTGSGASYTLTVRVPLGPPDKTVTCQVPAGAASSVDGDNTVSNLASVVFDQTPPTAVVTPVTVAPTTADLVQYTVVFSEPVGTSFTASDVLVNRGTLAGTVTSVTGVDPSYTVTVQLALPDANGTVGITIPPNVVSDLVGRLYAGNNTSALTTVYNWPGFGTDPAGGKFYVGDNHTLSVAVSTGGVATSYQWKHDTGAKALLDGPTTPDWALTNISAADAGTYWCEVTFDGVMHASAHAVLEVQPAVSVTAPTGATVQPGTAWSFTVVASGGYPFAEPSAPYSYQWKKNNVDIPGAPDSATLALTNLLPKDSGNYSVEVSDSNLGTKVSDAALLTVVPGVPVLGLGGMAVLAAALAGAAVRRRRN